MATEYIRNWSNGKTVYAHRVIWKKHYGKIPEGYDLHHKNGNKQDNRLSNLELLTRSDHTRIHTSTYKKISGEWRKFCVRCGKWFPLVNFYHQKIASENSIHYICKRCFIEIVNRRKEVVKNAQR